jgi:hypothetical protein
MMAARVGRSGGQRLDKVTLGSGSRKVAQYPLTMTRDHEVTFETLRGLLRAHSAGLMITADTPARFCLEATPGPATLAAWGGKLRKPTIPVAWVARSKTYVSYHLMALGGNAALVDRLSPSLRARMRGKTCFNFQRPESALFAELGDVTRASIEGFRRGGYTVSE